MTYVTGLVIPVPRANRETYIEQAALAAAWFRERGATRVTECWGIDVSDGELTSFPMAVKATGDEAVVFSWVEWPSRAICDEAMAAMFDAEAFNPPGGMPFDTTRMIFGGVEMVLDK